MQIQPCTVRLKDGREVLLLALLLTRRRCSIICA